MFKAISKEEREERDLRQKVMPKRKRSNDMSNLNEDENDET